LKKIDLEGTELQREGKSEVVNQELEKNAMYMSLLQELPVAKATSARVFLCGYPYAGKTLVVHQNISYLIIVYEFFFY
jgi:GTP1/Obg family GTP-binding protein